MTDDFPYTADGVVPGDFTEQFRYPIIHTSHPRWYYVTAVVVEDSIVPWGAGSVRPTDDELRVVASFHDQYIDHWYFESYKKKMRARPFDIDGGANGRFLTKYAHGGWGYRLMSWRDGPTFVPERREEQGSLAAVLDRIHSVGGCLSDRWVAWKTAHADVFAGDS